MKCVGVSDGYQDWYCEFCHHQKSVKKEYSGYNVEEKIGQNYICLLEKSAKQKILTNNKK